MLPRSSFKDDVEYLADLRDWFAGQALMGVIGKRDFFHPDGPSPCAEWAYKIADAMIAERNK